MRIMKYFLCTGIIVICLYNTYLFTKGGLELDNQPYQITDAGLSDEQWEFLKDYAKLIQYADKQGYKLTAGELYRTMYQQREYVRRGLSWTYNSNHLKRKAGDLNLFIDGVYQTNREAYRRLGLYWESLSKYNRWGGRFNDAPHFERLNKERR